MEQKVTEQDRVIAQLVGDNLDHLQDNMQLTTHINSLNARLEQMEHRLGQVGSVVMGFLEGRLEGLIKEEQEGTESSLSSDQGMSGASGEDRGIQASEEGSVDDGVFPQGSMRRADSPMPLTQGLIAAMERDAECHRYDFLVRLWNGLKFFELFKLLFGIDHDPPCSLCSHDLCLFSFSYVSFFARVYGQEKLLLYYDLFYDFGVLFYGRIFTLVFFYFLHNPTTPILPVYVDQRRPHLEKDTPRPRSMIIWKFSTVPRRTPFAPD